MAENKKSFVLYTDQIGIFNKLTDEQAGVLIKHIFYYCNDDDPTADFITELAFESIKQQLKRDLKKYEDRAERSKANGALGGRPKKPKETQKTQQVISKPKEPDNVNVNDTVTVNDNVIKKESIKEFWNLYHLESNKPKSDLQPATKHWNRLTEVEKDKAICNIKPYIDSVNDPKYIVKARTYLADKKFNDEFQSPKPKKMTEEVWNTMNEAERVKYFKNSLANG